jgi:hypothetical protein
MQKSRDEIIEQGTRVYYLYWDTDTPPGQGDATEEIYHLANQYWPVLSFDDPPMPFPTLLKAVKSSELNHISDTVQEVWSSEIPSDELATLLECDEGPGFRLQINKETWILGDDRKFVRQ